MFDLDYIVSLIIASIVLLIKNGIFMPALLSVLGSIIGFTAMLLAEGKNGVLQHIFLGVFTYSICVLLQIDADDIVIGYTQILNVMASDWGKDKNGKHHVLNGYRDSTNAHGSIWKNMGLIQTIIVDGGNFCQY